MGKREKGKEGEKGEIRKRVTIKTWTDLSNDHRYLIEIGCSSDQFKSAKLKDKEYTINMPIFFHNIAKKSDGCTKF